MDRVVERTDRLLSLRGDFDVSAFCRVANLLQAEPSAHIVLDFHEVRQCEPFVLGKLFDLIAHSDRHVRVRGLCQQQYALLGYLGFGSVAAPGHQPASMRV